ncbi:MAG: DUF6362 family protein [Tagaea sp.]|nr:DUF6362 family protein [Tagaea sp.]
MKGFASRTPVTGAVTSVTGASSPDRSSAKLSISDVEVRLERAFAALRRCPLGSRDRPAGLRAAWPEYVRELGLIDQLDLHTRVRPAPPQKHEYDEMVEALGWLLLIEDQLQRRIVMARVAGVGWLQIRAFADQSEPTMRKTYRLGLITIAARLNAKG